MIFFAPWSHTIIIVISTKPSIKSNILKLIIMMPRYPKAGETNPTVSLWVTNNSCLKELFIWDFFSVASVLNFCLTDQYNIFKRALLSIFFPSINQKTQVRCVAPLQCDDEGNKLVVPPAEVRSYKN